MKIKVPLFAAKVRRQYAAIVALFSALASFYFIVVTIQPKQKHMYVIWVSVALVVIYLSIWLRANFQRRIKLNINGSSLIIKVGDIFNQKGLKAIAFNEYFDTKVDDILISKSSLNGQYLSNHRGSNISQLDRSIDADVRLRDRLIETVTGRHVGKSKRYKLGSIYVDDEYLLIAFTHFDKDNRANLTLKEYVGCLLNFWEEVDQIYAGRSVSMPVLGSGITRFKDAEVQPEELLHILIWTFKISRVKFKYPANATIVIHSSMIDKINLASL